MTFSGEPGTGYEAADLSQPLYGAEVGQALVRFWQKFVVFTGRASPSEFWWWSLLSAGIATSLNSVSAGLVGYHSPVMSVPPDTDRYFRDMLRYQLETSAGTVVWSLVTLVGMLALGVRRLHDTNRSGWWYLVGLVPFVGWIVLVVFWAEPPRPVGQRCDR